MMMMSDMDKSIAASAADAEVEHFRAGGGRVRGPRGARTSGRHGHGQARLRAPSSSAAALALRGPACPRLG